MNKTNESKMKSAFPRERVPNDLQEKTMLREKAVVMGRRAEEMLLGKSAPDAASVDGLMAQAMVGRMALATELPTGAAPEKMAQALQKTEGFRTYRAKNMETQLAELHSGAFMKELAPQKAAEKSSAAPQKTNAPMEKGMTR